VEGGLSNAVKGSEKQRAPSSHASQGGNTGLSAVHRTDVSKRTLRRRTGDKSGLRDGDRRIWMGKRRGGKIAVERPGKSTKSKKISNEWLLV